MPTYTTGHDETLPDGIYDFEVIDATETTSKAGGNPMIELALMVHGPNGGSGIRVFDRLVFTPKAFWKIDSFRIATGEKLVEGQTVSIEASDCIDRTGKCSLIIEKYGGHEHNRIGAYIDPASEKPPPAPAKKETLAAEELRRKGADPDDDIPF
jgi:hypothetical protein